MATDSTRSGLAPAASFADFAAAPRGRWMAGPSFVYAWPSAELAVTILSGRPGAADFESLVSLFALELRDRAVPHASVIDTTRVDGVDERAFAVLTGYVRAHAEAMRRYVTRLAIVRSSGFAGAVAAGFYATLDAPYPVEVHKDLRSAMAWVGASAATERAIEALAGASGDLPDLLRDVRRAIAARLPDASVEAVARDLAVAVRTLQRRLRGLDTTFRKELAAVQVETTKRLLASTDAPISRIAFDVGSATPQHLSALFRRATGVSPSAWRAGQRAVRDR